MARTRPLPLILLAVAAVGAVATAVSPGLQDRLDRPAREQARAVAEALPAPTGATESTACHGDGLVACWETGESVVDVARELARTMGEQARIEATSTCQAEPVDTSGGQPPSDSCFVRVRFRSHGTFAFVDPLFARDEETGTASVVGARVSVSAN